MLSDALMEDILKHALARGGEFADVFCERKQPVSITLEGSKVEDISTGAVTGVGIRLVFGGGRSAYAVSNDLSPKALIDAADSLARAAAGNSKPDASLPLMDLTTPNPGIRFKFEQMPGDVSIEARIALVKEADRAARFSEEIAQVRVIYRDYVQEVQIASSISGLASETRVHTVGIVQAVARRDTVVQTGTETVAGLRGFDIFKDEPLHEAAARAGRRAVALLSARRAPGGRMPVVISSKAGGTMIHEAIGHALEGDLTGQGLSKFSGRMGETVASPLVSVVDDPTLAGRRGSYGFDDEGTPSKRNVLLDSGVLKGYMHDRVSAMRAGAEPTGNGRRESYLSRPIPRMSNTFIAPGAHDPAEVLGSTAEGLLVIKMGGGQVNTVTGDFVFDVMEGYLIKDGKRGELVRGATLTGNGPEVLMAVDMVGSDLGFSVGTCGKDAQGVPVSDAMPTIRIPEMVVGGEA